MKDPSRTPLPGPPLGPVLEFMQRLWAVSHALDSASKRMGLAFGVTGPQRLVIRMIGRFPGISAGNLSDILHAHPSTLTGILRRLQRRGLILRAVDSTDGRRMLFELSPRGRQVDRLRAGTVEAAVEQALARANRRDVATSARLLARIASELDSRFSPGSEVKGRIRAQARRPKRRLPSRQRTRRRPRSFRAPRTRSAPPAGRRSRRSQRSRRPSAG